MARAERSVFAPALAAIAHRWRPIVLIQGCVIAIVALYYTSPAVQGGTQEIGRIKASGGYAFAFLANAFAGAVLPEMAKRLTMKGQGTRVPDLLFQCLFFGVLGVFVDFQYQLLGVIIGQGVSFEVLLKKVLVDQFVSSPVTTIPFSAAVFLWKDQGFRLRRFPPGAFPGRYWPMLVTCWAYWVPVVAAVYAMPPDLQFCLFLGAQAAWSLLIMHISGQ